jgi:hypothetical protein
VVVVHLVLVHLVVGKVLCWGCCHKSSQVEDGIEVHAIVVDHHGMHGEAVVGDNRASVVVLNATGKGVVCCSLDGCVVADHGHSHIPGLDLGGSHCRHDRVNTFPILFLSWCILCVGLFPYLQSGKLCGFGRLSSQSGRDYPCFDVELLLQATVGDGGRSLTRRHDTTSFHGILNLSTAAAVAEVAACVHFLLRALSYPCDVRFSESGSDMRYPRLSSVIFPPAAGAESLLCAGQYCSGTRANATGGDDEIGCAVSTDASQPG